jgi:5-methylthioadenosine/S-adenosylhomocysteine deaminase
MYYFSDTIAESIVKAGMKANLTRAVACPADFDFGSHNAVKEMIALKEKWHGYDRNRIIVEVGIHAEYTSYPRVWGDLADYAAANKLGMHVHLSETKSEHENCISKYGMTPAAVLAKYGVFDVPTIAAHCVWVSDDDIALLSEKGVSAVNNPVSNMKLASGIAPAAKMLAAGLNVALGTDSVASNNSHDMFEEIKMATLCQKVKTLDPVALTAGQALKMATVNGAKAQRRSGECGMIKAGMDADLIMLDFDRPHLTPCHHVISNLVYSARGSDVVMNMVRGKIIYRDGEHLTIDIEKVKHGVRKAVDIFGRH